MGGLWRRLLVGLGIKKAKATLLVVGLDNSGKTTQQFKVANSMHGQKPVVLKVKIEYNTMGSQVSEMGSVDQFPPGI